MGGPINPDREQQRADNNASRRQSGLEPLPRDIEEEGAEDSAADASDDRDRGQNEGRRASRDD